MKTKEQVLEAVRSGKKAEAIDGRDFSRLCEFFPVEQYELFGLKLKDGAQAPAVKDWTQDAVLAQLAEDLDFAFEKALDKRGLSAGAMFVTILMWMWVLDDPLQYFSEDNYANYGLPMFKAVAIKYNLPNPIGEDTGTEGKYSTYGA